MKDILFYSSLCRLISFLLTDEFSDSDHFNIDFVVSVGYFRLTKTCYIASRCNRTSDRFQVVKSYSLQDITPFVSIFTQPRTPDSIQAAMTLLKNLIQGKLNLSAEEVESQIFSQRDSQKKNKSYNAYSNLCQLLYRIVKDVKTLLQDQMTEIIITQIFDVIYDLTYHPLITIIKTLDEQYKKDLENVKNYLDNYDKSENKFICIESFNPCCYSCYATAQLVSEFYNIYYINFSYKHVLVDDFQICNSLNYVNRFTMNLNSISYFVRVLEYLLKCDGSNIFLSYQNVLLCYNANNNIKTNVQVYQDLFLECSTKRFNIKLLDTVLLSVIQSTQCVKYRTQSELIDALDIIKKLFVEETSIRKANSVESLKRNELGSPLYNYVLYAHYFILYSYNKKFQDIFNSIKYIDVDNVVLDYESEVNFF